MNFGVIEPGLYFGMDESIAKEYHCRVASGKSEV
jgi:hypothetical protein